MKLFILALSGFTLSISLMAQTPITQVDIETTIGTTFQYRASGLVSQGEGGENAIWDFSELTNQGSTNYAIVDTTGLLGITNFIDPNLAWQRGSQEVYDYMQISTDKLQAVGTYAFDDSYFDYTNPITMVQFPIDILDAYSDDYEFDYDLISVQGSVTGTVDFLVDGYGTLILPWGTVTNAYRVKFTIEQTEVFDAGQGEQTSTYTAVNYSWFAPGFPGELMRTIDGLITISGQEIPNQASQYISEFGLSIGETKSLELENFEVYPNPAKDIVTVQFDSRVEDYNLKLYDIQGRVIIQNTIPYQGIGKVVQQLDMSGSPAGYYLLVVESSRGVKSQKISKLR